jgi:hypothetical protein
MHSDAHVCMPPSNVLEEPLPGSKLTELGTDNAVVVKSVTDIIRFVPADLLQRVQALLQVHVIRPVATKVQLQDSIDGRTEGTLEYVANFNGLAVPAFLEVDEGAGECTMLKRLKVDHAHQELKTRVRDWTVCFFPTLCLASMSAVCWCAR